MNNRLQTLELERERLESVLADDANWCAFLEAQRRRAAGLPGSAVTKEIAKALAENKTVFAYLKVAEEIAAENAKINESVPSASVAPEPVDSHSPHATQEPTNAEPSQETVSEVDDTPVSSSEPGPQKPTPPPAQSSHTETEPQEAAAFRTRVNLKAAQAPTIETPEADEPVAETPVPDSQSTLSEDLSRSTHTPQEDALVPPLEERASQAEAHDDLTLIRSIDRALASELRAIGVTSYLQIARWNGDEVRQVRDALNLDIRIWQENWIEQAALLVGPEFTPDDLKPSPAMVPLQSASHEHGPPSLVDLDTVAPDECSAVSATDAALAVSATSIVATTAAVTSSETSQDGKSDATQEAEASAPALPGRGKSIDVDDFNGVLPAQAGPTPSFKIGVRSKRLPPPAARRFIYIRGVSDEIAEALRSAGVSSIADIAGWTRADVRWFKAILGDGARISQDQWIEQARLLSNGAWTSYALRVVRGETRALVERSPALHSAQSPTSLVASEDRSARSSPSVAKDLTPESASQPPSADKTDGPAPPTPAMTPRIGLGGQLRRPPPDLGMRWRQPVRLTPPIASKIEPAKTELMQRLADADDAQKVATFEKPVEPVPPEKIELPALDEIEADAPPLSEEELARLVEADDWDDADALVIARGGQSNDADLDLPSVSSSTATDQDSSPTLPAPVDTLAEIDGTDRANANDIALPLPGADGSSEPNTATSAGPALVLPGPESNSKQSRVDRSNLDTDADNEPAATAPSDLVEPASQLPPSDNEFAWGDEADVVIVSRPRTAASATEDPPETAHQAWTKPDVSAISPPRKTKPKERIEKSPELIARRKQDRRTFDEQSRDDRSNYSAASEEATVTIIRAEASETDAASVMPTNIANDADGEALEDRPTVRKIGARFLKALTGD